jgi:hypothetical protein
MPRALVSKQLYTTGHWYVRLCQAALGASDRSGVLSLPFAELPPSLREKAIEALLQLPPSIGLISLRDLAPSIAHLRHRHQLNMLSIEALAAAVHLRAQVFLSADSPLLERAVRLEKLTVKAAPQG